ncbi:MAG: hypothetical protein WD972_01925, partial [Candidatus Andersenbacteria bacterium]
LRLENVATQTAGTLTDTARVLEIVQDADSSGDAFAIAHAGSGNAVRINDDGTLTDSTPFVIEADGDVGIGTTAPSALFEVGSTVDNGFVVSESSGFTHISVNNAPLNLDNLAIRARANGWGFQLSDSAGNAGAIVGFRQSDGGGTSGGRFFARAVYNGADTINMDGATGGISYINTGGNVGIGDTSPAYLLTVGSGDLFGVQSDSSLIWEGTSADASETTLSVVNPTADITYQLADAAAGTYDLCSTAGNCLTGGGAATLQTAYNAGNIISTTDGRDIEITLNDTATDQTLEITQAGTVAAFRVNDDGTFTDSSPFVVDASGQVGIGIAVPTKALDINGSINMLDTTTSTSGIVFKAGTGFLHNYATAGSDGLNTFVGKGAGNFTMGPGGGAASLASDNSIVGAGALALNTTGYKNAALGSVALANNDTGFSNAAIGWRALQSNTSGNNNLAIGSSALRSSTTSSQNIAIGASAMSGDIPGSNNVAIGTLAQQYNQGSSYNTAIGQAAMGSGLYNVTGGYNVAIGNAAGGGVGAGIQNVLIGSEADIASPTISNSIAIGQGVVTTASNQAIIGNSSITQTLLSGNVGIGDTSPAYLLTVGSGDLFGVQSDSSLIWEGTSADASETTLSVVNPTADITYQLADAAAGTYDLCSTAGNCLTGGGAATLQTAYNAGNIISTTDGRDIEITLNDTATDQTLEITQAGTVAAFRVNDDGTFTDSSPFVVDASGQVGIGIAVPTKALDINGSINMLDTTTSTSGIVFKAGTGFLHNYATAGSDGLNTFVGKGAGNFTMGPGGGAASLASDNSIVGAGALALNTTGYKNAALGSVALANNDTGFSNAAIGWRALQSNTSGNNNLAIGSSALRSSTTSSQNIAIGASAMSGDIPGSNNVAIGTLAQQYNQGSSYNTAIGQAAMGSGLYNVTGGYNVAIGNAAGGGVGAGIQNVLIGSEADIASPTISNSIAIGQGVVTTASNQAIIGNSSITQTLLSGNVGIGSTAPEALLEVQGVEATDAVIALDADDGDDAADTWFIKSLASGNSLSVLNDATEVFNLSSGGNLQIDGDLTISGDDLFMATNTSGHILVADGTNYNPVAMSGDITIDSTGATAIGSDKVTEADLKAVNGGTDEFCLTYETTTGDFEWEDCVGGSGGLSSFTLAGDAGTPQTISDSDTLTVATSAHLTATAGATDT